MSKRKDLTSSEEGGVIRSDGFGFVKVMIRGKVSILYDEFEALCPECEGKGEISSALWSRWMLENPSDWPALVSSGECPKGAPLEVCKDCNGYGTLLTNLGHSLLGFMCRHTDLNPYGGEAK